MTTDSIRSDNWMDDLNDDYCDPAEAIYENTGWFEETDYDFELFAELGLSTKSIPYP